MPIKHSDGADYFSQAEVEAMIKDRVRNVGAEVTSAQNLAKEWEQRYKAIEPKIATADTLAAQIADLQGKLGNAEGGLKRYQAAASHGITDPDTIWALEQAHQRAMTSVEAGKQVDFGGYLGTLKADPSQAPAYLRSVFAGGAPAASPAPPTPGNGPAAPAAPAPRPAWAPATAGQQPVAAGQAQSFADRAAAARSFDDLVKLQQERQASRRS